MYTFKFKFKCIIINPTSIYKALPYNIAKNTLINDTCEMIK